MSARADSPPAGGDGAAAGLDLSDMPNPFGPVTEAERQAMAREAQRRADGIPLPDDTEPQAAPREAPPPELHAAALHGPAGRLVADLRGYTEACDAAVLAQLLAVTGCAIGRGPYVNVGTVRQPARIFPLLVGSTGRGRKGTALAQALAVFEHPDGPSSVLARVRSNVQSGEAIIEAVRDGEGDEPGVEDKRLLALETEFGNVLASKGRSGSILTGVMRQAWEGDNLFNTKVKAVKATGAHVVFVGHVTPDELHHAAGKTDVANGFLNRFLLVHSEQARSIPLPDPPPDGLLSGLARTFSAAVGDGMGRGRVALSPAGVAAWTFLYPHLDTDDEGAVGDMLGRVKPYLLRVALVYALLDRAAHVEPVHLLAAAAVCDYHTATVRRVYGARGAQALDDRILDAVRDAGGEITRTELSGKLNHHAKAAAIGAAVARLERAGLVSTGRRGGTGGRTAATVRMCEGSERTRVGLHPLTSLLSQFAGDSAHARI